MSKPAFQCEVYSVCGAFGVCDQNNIPYCKCLIGFEPSSKREWDLNGWSAGCVRKTLLQCGINNSVNGEQGEFLMMRIMRLPVNPQSFVVRSAEDCKLACLNNCSCTAYAYDSRCSIWNGELRNLQQLSDNDNSGSTLYLRLATSDLPSTSNKHKILATAIVVGAVAGSLTAVCIVLGLIWRCRARTLAERFKSVKGSLVPFTYTDLQHMTKNFSQKLGGGGFGSVFAGALPDSTAITVKKLEGFRQGEKQFRTEVSTLGTIQHVNLVRLRGFCSEGTKKLLVYDYMPNGSLDSHLFRNDSKILDWKTRCRIVLGIARGLTYLHERCRECIIHCDIKPENILLDAGFCPKVADFGLAKLMGRDFSRVLTTMRGTISYLAPEWISGVAISPKADVYSFGMMLFEIISGKQNREYSEDGNVGFFPIRALNKANRGDVLSLLDVRLEGFADTEELTRACRVAGWCIEDCEDHRPSMGLVVQILEGALDISVPPIPRSLQDLIGD